MFFYFLVAIIPVFFLKCRFYSWAHTARQMSILQYQNKNVTNITHISQSTEWVIYHTCASNETIITSEDLYWWVTNYVIYIKRQSIYHIYQIVLPCGVLSCLSPLLFLLPPDSGKSLNHLIFKKNLFNQI